MMIEPTHFIPQLGIILRTLTTFITIGDHATGPHIVLFDVRKIWRRKAWWRWCLGWHTYVHRRRRPCVNASSGAISRRHMIQAPRRLVWLARSLDVSPRRRCCLGLGHVTVKQWQRLSTCRCRPRMSADWSMSDIRVLLCYDVLRK